jgi:hypothetical protein
MKPRRVSIAPARRKRTRRSIDSVEFDPAEEHIDDLDGDTLPSWRKHPFALLGGAALLLYVVGAIALQAFVDEELVRAWVAPRASAALNRTVTIEGGGVGLFPRPSVHLSNIAVANLSGFDSPTLARVERVRMDLGWLPLLIGRVRVTRLHLDGAAVHLTIDENGRPNFGDLVPRPQSDADAAASAPVGIALRHISVSDASVTYFDTPRGRSMGVTGGEASVSLDAFGEDGWQADVTLDSDSLMLRAANLSTEIARTEGPGGKLVARGGTRGLVQLESGFIALARDTLHLRGRITGIAEAAPSFELELTNDAMNARALSAVFPADVRSSMLPHTEGTLAVAVRVVGGLASNDRPTVDGTVRLQDVTLRLHGEPLAEDVNGLVAMDAERIRFDSVEGTFAGGAFALSGLVARDDRATTSVVARAHPNLDVLDGLGLLPSSVALSGSAELDLSVAGPIRSPDSIQVVGTTAFEGFRLQHDSLGVPVYVPAGTVSLSGRDMSWSDLTVLLGTDDLTTSGELRDAVGFWLEDEITPRVQASFAGPSLHLDAVFPPRPDEQPSYAEIAFAHLSGRPIDGRDPAVVAGELGLHRMHGMRLTGSLDLRFDTLAHGEQRVEDLVARVELTDSSLSFSDASFGAWGGRARGALTLGVGQAAYQPFSISLDVQGADATAFLPNTEGGEISGALDILLELSGTTDARLLPNVDGLAGTAQVAVVDGRVTGTGVNAALADFLESEQWAAIPFARASAAIDVREGVVEVRDGDLVGDLSRIVFEGLIDFSGASDVSLAVSVPPQRLDAVSLRRTGLGRSVVDQLRIANRPLELGLHLSGPLGAPTLEPNAANAIALARR